MPRRNQPARRGAAGQARGHGGSSSADGSSGRGSVGERVDWWRGHEYRLRTVTGAASAGSGKPYRCPGCDQLIAAGVPHVVVWPADDLEAADRRHWHGACWSARDRRLPGVQRSRNAPRYG